MSKNLSNKMKGMKKIVLGIFCLVAALFVCAAFDDVKSVSADNIYYYQSSGMHPDGNKGLVLVPKAGTTYASAATKPAEIENYQPSSVDFDGYYTSKFTKAFNTTKIDVVVSVPSSYEFNGSQVNWVVNETFYQINVVRQRLTMQVRVL